MAQSLTGKKVAILATDGFEQVELTQLFQALKNEGAQVEIVAPHGGEIQGFRHLDKGTVSDRSCGVNRP
jgi:deglycase